MAGVGRVTPSPTTTPASVAGGVQVVVVLRPSKRKQMVLIALHTCDTLKRVKQNATNNLAPFFKLSFNALSDGVLHFAHCVAPDPAVDWL